MQVHLLTIDEALELGDARLGLRQFVGGPRGGGDGVRGGRRRRRRAARRPFPPDFGPRLRFKPAAPKAR